jgi:hypothetical protein
MDDRRTKAHDAFIDACDILARDMRGRDIEPVWRQELGEDRREIGDFACLLHCIIGISAR